MVSSRLSVVGCQIPLDFGLWTFKLRQLNLMLSLLGWIYGEVADIRNHLYERGVFETHDLGARTISVGNITAGGTGKTPLVAYIAEILARRGEKVCILTRGYGRKDPVKRVLVSDESQILTDPLNAGDEPLELAQKLLGKAIVLADADRVAAADWAKRKFGITAFVLDDGFQHRKAKRDVDIVCIDATDPFGGGKMLPAGRLREPLNNLKRADIIVITRANLVTDISNLRSEIFDLNRDAVILTASTLISRFVPLEEFHSKTQSSQREFGQQNVFAFCGLGNPENFFEQLRRKNVSIVGTRAFPDHHEYDQNDVVTIEEQARQSGSGILLTTAKDAVKLSDLKFEVPCYVVEIEMQFDDTDVFEFLLLEKQPIADS